MCIYPLYLNIWFAYLNVSDINCSTWNLPLWCVISLIVAWGHSCASMGDLSSLTGDWSHIPCVARWILNYQIPREVRTFFFFSIIFHSGLPQNIEYCPLCYTVDLAGFHRPSFKPPHPHCCWLILYKLIRILLLFPHFWSTLSEYTALYQYQV